MATLASPRLPSSLFTCRECVWLIMGGRLKPGVTVGAGERRSPDDWRGARKGLSRRQPREELQRGEDVGVPWRDRRRLGLSRRCFSASSVWCCIAACVNLAGHAAGAGRHAPARDCGAPGDRRRPGTAVAAARHRDARALSRRRRGRAAADAVADAAAARACCRRCPCRSASTSSSTGGFCPLLPRCRWWRRSCAGSRPRCRRRRPTSYRR